jgi:predicted phage tail protein
MSGVPLANTTGDVLSFTDPSWMEGDKYRVVAQNTVGDTWDYSDPNLNEIQPGTYAFPVFTVQSVSDVLDTTQPAPTAPAAPSDLAATEEAGPQVKLTWVDNANNETGFVVEKSTDGITFAALPAVIGPDTTSFVDADVLPGSTYIYQVAAVNDVGPSAYSNTASVTLTTPPTAPAAPSDLTAVQLVAQEVTLAWVDNANNETGFAIERSEDGVNFAPLTTVGADTTAFADSTVSAGVTYTYQVAAVNDVGPSAYSNMASVAVIDPPVAPDQLEANFEDVPLINLVWADISADETGFVIQRSTDGVTFADLTTVAANITEYDDLDVLGSVTYTYRVAAVNGTVMSAFSDPSVGILVPDFTTPPAAPSGLFVTNLAVNSLTLNWLDNSNNELGFTIQRATNSSFTRGLATFNVGANVSSYNDSGLKKNTTYYYRVQAVNLFNDGLGPFPWSPTFNITTPR